MRELGNLRNLAFVSNPIMSPYDRDELRDRFQSATPFPHLVISEFLEAAFVRECAAAYPSYEEAKRMGNEFGALNERLKVQICDVQKFQSPVALLEKALSSPEFLADLEHISGIKSLLADPDLGGGGMHVMGGSGGRLDVHVDFNYLEEKQWHRRLNLLVYLNPEWEASWGGAVELWDTDVKTCHQSVLPHLNTCVLFETSEVSYHGVTPLSTPKGKTRNSFAVYYYTKEAPASWNGVSHSTVFRNRPNEKFREHVLAPAERLGGSLVDGAYRAKNIIKKLIKN